MWEPARVELNDGRATDSQVDRLKDDWTQAIIHGVSPAAMKQLIDRSRQLDNDLAAKLSKTRDELADFASDGFDPINANAIRRLRRTRSLTWLSRIELSALQSECYSSGTPDAVSAAAKTIELVKQAIVELPSSQRAADDSVDRNSVSREQGSGGMIQDEVNRLLTEAHLQAGDGWAAENTWFGKTVPSASKALEPDELALAIRIDLANRRYDVAEARLRTFYAANPLAAKASVPMDLAMLEFLSIRAKGNESILGNWLDTIEKRGGNLARQRAESMVARKRQADSVKPSSKPDPRLLRADGRYYYRIDQPLQAAVSFARATVLDPQFERATDSAIQSAAILKKLGKHQAAKELLLQTARRHSSQSDSANLVLQAARLASESADASVDEVQAILTRCLESWPTSMASKSARDWLIRIAVKKGNRVEAASLATRLPSEHWNEAAARRCVDLWSEAIAGVNEAGASEFDNNEKTLQVMQLELEQASGNAEIPWLRTAWASLMILVGDSTDELPLIAADVDDAYLSELAEFRNSPAASTEPSAFSGNVSDLKLAKVVRWRLQRDIEKNPQTASPIAVYLLKSFPSDDLSTLRWLVQSGQTQRATELMRTKMDVDDRPEQWLRTMAKTLSETSYDQTFTDRDRVSRLKLASSLWRELSDGLPQNDPAGTAAMIEAIRCQFLSGDRAAAAAQSQLIMLTQPPSDPALKRLLNEMLE